MDGVTFFTMILGPSQGDDNLLHFPQAGWVKKMYHISLLKALVITFRGYLQLLTCSSMGHWSLWVWKWKPQIEKKQFDASRWQRDTLNPLRKLVNHHQNVFITPRCLQKRAYEVNVYTLHLGWGLGACLHSLIIFLFWWLVAHAPIYLFISPDIPYQKNFFCIFAVDYAVP